MTSEGDATVSKLIISAPHVSDGPEDRPQKDNARPTAAGDIIGKKTELEPDLDKIGGGVHTRMNKITSAMGRVEVCSGEANKECTIDGEVWPSSFSRSHTTKLANTTRLSPRQAEDLVFYGSRIRTLGRAAHGQTNTRLSPRQASVYAGEVVSDQYSPPLSTRGLEHAVHANSSAT